jgi:hypothetical protein
MQAFEPSSDMLSMAGAFYPTGYIFLMFPTEADARAAGAKIESASASEKPLMLLSPDETLGKVVRTVGSADIPLPSVGVEADTVRRYADLASNGHWSLMVHAPDAKDSDAVMDIVRGTPMSCAIKYRMLVIEDLA